MLLSYCFTCHKRTDDLLAVMPSVVVAANQSPPVEIIIVDYGNQEPLEPLLEQFHDQLKSGNTIHIKTYRKRNYYHMGHARNLSLRAATGEYVIISASDVIPKPNFFSTVRECLAQTGAVFLRSKTTGYVGLLTCRRDVMMELGGYDERFEFYGPEDKDFLHRLERRGAQLGYYDLDAIIGMIRTSDQDKTANYRLMLSKGEMSERGRAILLENDTRGRITVNEDRPWGEE